MPKHTGEASHTLTLGTDVAVPEGELAQLLLSFITTSSESILITDADLESGAGPKIQFANHAVQEYTGYTEAQLLGQPLAMLYTPDAMPQILADMREAIRSGRASRRERQVMAANGQPYWVEIEAVPVADAEGRIIRFIRAGRNITRRKHAEMLRASGERLMASVLGVTREALVVITGTGHIAMANSAFTRRFGWPGAEVASTLWQDYIAGGNPDRIMSEITRPAEEIHSVVSTVRCVDGGVLPCQLTVSTVRQPDGTLYYVLTVIPDETQHSPLVFEENRKT